MSDFLLRSKSGLIKIKFEDASLFSERSRWNGHGHVIQYFHVKGLSVKVEVRFYSFKTLKYMNYHKTNIARNGDENAQNGKCAI